MLSSVDDQYAFGGDPAAGDCAKSLADIVLQRRSVEIETELNGGRHLVDILAARPGCAHEPLLDLAVADLEPRRDHESHLLLDPVRHIADDRLVDVPGDLVLRGQAPARPGDEQVVQPGM